MEIRAVLFSENIVDIPGSDGALNKAIINPTYLFTLEFMPTTFSFSVLIMLETESLESMYNFELLLKKGYDTTPVFQAKSSFDTSSILKTENITNKAALNLNLGLQNVSIKEEGDYTFEVYINSKLAKSESLTFIKKKVDEK